MDEEYIKKLIKKEKLDALEKVDVSINKRIQHLKSAPETISLIKKVELQIELMKKDIKNQSDKVDQLLTDNKEQHKEILEEIKNIAICKADKEEVNKLEEFIGKVMWVAVTSLIGFLVTLVLLFVGFLMK